MHIARICTKYVFSTGVGCSKCLQGDKLLLGFVPIIQPLSFQSVEKFQLTVLQLVVERGRYLCNVDHKTSKNDTESGNQT